MPPPPPPRGGWAILLLCLPVLSYPGSALEKPENIQFLTELRVGIAASMQACIWIVSEA